MVWANGVGGEGPNISAAWRIAIGGERMIVAARALDKGIAYQGEWLRIEPRLRYDISLLHLGHIRSPLTLCG